MIEVSAPGKLFIAGEYAVVEPGFPAVLIAVNRFMTVQITPQQTAGHLISQEFASGEYRWQRETDGKLIVAGNPEGFEYVLAAIELVEQYALEQGVGLQYYDLTIINQLIDTSGNKYGLGSSAALTVATVRALNQLYQLQLDLMQQFKLAAIAHLAIQGNGSCGDIASSCFGGWIAFATFDAVWLQEKQQIWSLTALLAANWPNLMIKSLKIPTNLHVLIGWTGTPASTSDLVDQVQQSGKNQTEKVILYQLFLEASKACVEELLHAFDEGNTEEAKAAISRNREILRGLTNITGVTIETTLLEQLCDIAESYGGAAKSSGAGGGDCGIVFADETTEISKIINTWETIGVIPLPLEVYHLEEDRHES